MHEGRPEHDRVPMSSARRISTCGGALLLLLASCASPRSDDDGGADLDAALAGRPDAATVNAMVALERGITVAHWSYLMGAQWPEDPNRMITDPWLRDAMNVLANNGTSARTASFDGLRPAAWGPAPGYGTYDPALLSSTYAGALNAMRARNGAPTLRTPGAVAAYVRTMTFLVSTSDGSVLPAPTTPADEFTGVCVVEFHKSGNPPQICSTKPLCCKETIDYKTGISICYDNTSCKGQGLPQLPAGPSGGPDAGGATPLGRCGDLAEDFLFYGCSHLSDGSDGVYTGGSGGRCKDREEISDELDYRCKVDVKLGRCLRFAPGVSPPGGEIYGSTFIGGAKTWADDSVNWCVP